MPEGSLSDAQRQTLRIFIMPITNRTQTFRTHPYHICAHENCSRYFSQHYPASAGIYYCLWPEEKEHKMRTPQQTEDLALYTEKLAEGDHAIIALRTSEGSETIAARVDEMTGRENRELMTRFDAEIRRLDMLKSALVETKSQVKATLNSLIGDDALLTNAWDQR